MNHRYLFPLLTIVVVLLAYLGFQYAPDSTTMSNWGNYISGIAAALAFLWLIASFIQQTKELKIQRKELTLQRLVLELQKDELKRLNKYNALGQISAVLDGFCKSLPRTTYPAITNPDQLSVEFMKGMTHWKTIMESDDPHQVNDSHLQWMPIEKLCTEFISAFTIAINLYAEATGELQRVTDEDAVAYIHFNHDKISHIPHLQQYSGAACAVASNLFLMGPGLARVRLAGYSAINTLHPKIIEKNALAKLQQEVARLDAELEKRKQNR